LFEKSFSSGVHVRRVAWLCPIDAVGTSGPGRDAIDDPSWSFGNVAHVFDQARRNGPIRVLQSSLFGSFVYRKERRGAAIVVAEEGNLGSCFHGL
jgi:hypothetical protein